VRFIAGDLRSKDGVDAVAAAALDHLGGDDIVVNNAGASRLPPGGALEIEPDQWQEDLDVNLLAAVRLNAALAPQMLERGSGAIVHIASSAAYTLPGSLLHYGVSKAALIAYSKGLATELAPHGVRVNTITPGSIQSPGGDSAREQIAAAIGVEPAALLASIPVGHIGRADDIGNMVTFLLSDDGSWVTGQVIAVDGGVTMRP